MCSSVIYKSSICGFHFVKTLEVGLYGAWIFLDLICAIHLEMSHQFVASIFGIPLSVEIYGNLLSNM